MHTITTENKSRSDKFINILSIAIPLAVAILIGIRTKIDLGTWTKILPHVIAALNASTSLLLIISLISIKNKNINIHRAANLGAFGLGAVFLVTYILYHISNPSTSYGGEGILKSIYYFFLLSHIILSIAVVRLVLLSMHYAINNQIAEHKKIVKWAYPIWLYVSVSGVVVYLMISPYYK